MKLDRFAKFAWGVLVYNLAVIAWGAFVRASGSGAGCGSHWPSCGGEIIPRAAPVETLIEFTHRMMSGTAFLLVAGLLVWAWRAYPKEHSVRLGAVLSMVFMVTEALVGAGLVLFELVAENDSIARALAISVHLVNTFLLLAALSMTAWWASGAGPVRLRGDISAWLFAVALLGMLVLGTSGAVTALGDTLFPSGSLAQALQEDFSATAHILIRLRVLHPTIAVIVSVYLIVITNWISRIRQTQVVRDLGKALILLVILQLTAGVINVFLLAPIWMQLVHLLLSDAIWITLVLLAAGALSFREADLRIPSLSSKAATLAKSGETH
ncbi:MAG TPA: COX15/CtaA family protein [Anaerolineales bacterium]